MCRMGPCMIKLGQWAATRPDLFPLELCHRLARLHRSVPTHPYAHTEEQMRLAYGREVEEVFLHFDKEPIASGAIAQVYTAVMQDGTKVAVKVRHPHVTDTITQDLRIIRSVTHWVRHHSCALYSSLSRTASPLALSCLSLPRLSLSRALSFSVCVRQ